MYLAILLIILYCIIFALAGKDLNENGYSPIKSLLISLFWPLVFPLAFGYALLYCLKHTLATIIAPFNIKLAKKLRNWLEQF